MTSRFVDNSGRILLYSQAKGQVFPWNPLTRDWETSIPIVGSPALLTFVPERNEWWAAFPDKTIRPATLGATGPTLRVPEPAVPPIAFHWVKGRFAYVSSTNVHLIGADGVESARMTHVDFPTSAVWDSLGERLVVGRSSRLRSFAVTPAGGLLAGEVKNFVGLGSLVGTTGSNHVAFTSGHLLDLRSLDQVARFSGPLAGAAKVGVSLLTLRQNGADSLIESYHPASIQRLPGSLELDGAPLFIENTLAGVVVATVIDTVIRLHLVAENLSLQHVSAAPARSAKDFGITSLSATGARFHWTDNSDNETGIRIEGQVAGSSTWIPLGTAPAGAGSATVDALQAGAVYQFRIVTLSGAYESAGPATEAVTLPATSTALGGEPYELRALHANGQSVTLGWRDHSSSETGFRLQRRTPGPAGPVVTLDLPANTSTHTDQGLASNTLYEYRIQAIGSDGPGTLSQPREVRTTPANPSAKSVTNLALVSLLPGEAVLSWTDNSTDEEEFIIQRSISGDPAVRQEIGRASRNATGFTDPSPPRGVLFSYYVLTINRPGGAPAYSSELGPFFIPLEAGQYREIHHIHRGIHYFVFDTPNLIQRYDTASRTWLEPIHLIAPARGFWVDDDGIFTGQGPDLVRIPLAGGTAVPLITLENGSPASIFATNRWLSYRIVNNSTQHRYRVFDKFTGQAVVPLNALQPPIAAEFLLALRFAVRHPALDQVVGWNALDDSLFTFGITDQGFLPASNQTVKHGGSPRHPRLIPSPDGGRWFASSGTVFSSGDLTRTAELGFNFTDLAFYPDGRMIALRERMLVRLSSDLTVQGRMSLDTAGIALSTSGNDILRFTLDPASPAGIQASVVPPDAFGLPSPDPGLEPPGLDFIPERHFLSTDGTLLMPSRKHASVFRWSTVARDWLPTIRLPSPPLSSDLAVERNRLYLLGEDQILRRIDLADPALEAVPLRHVIKDPSFSGWVAWLDDMLLARGVRLTSTDPDGSALFSRLGTFFNGPPTSTAWHPDLRRFYATSGGSLHRMRIESDGQFIGSSNTSLDDSPSPFAILNLDLGLLFTSNGSFRSTDTLAISSSLAEKIAAAAWDGNDIISLTEKDGDTILRRWRFPAYSKSGDGTSINGVPLGIFPTADGWLAVTNILGRPRFTLLDENFGIDHISPAPLFAPDSLQVTDRTPTSVSLYWRDRLDDESGYRVEYRLTGGNTWLPGSELPAGSASGIVTGMIPDTRYDFRVIAFRDETESLPSGLISTRTLLNDLEPIGEPYDLRLTRSSVDFLTLEWNDNADNETGFRIIRTSTLGTVTTYNLPPDTKAFTNSGLAPNSRFNYQVQILGPAGVGELSASLQATTERFLFPPGSPLDLTVTAVEPQLVTFTWRSGLTEDGFIISRAPASDTNSWTELARTGPNSHHFTDGTVEPGTSYLYRVIAFNREGESPGAFVPATTPELAAEYLGISAKDHRFLHFGFRRPNQITRYDLETRTWLAPVPLNWEPTHIVPSSEGLVIVADQRVHLLRPGEITPVAFPRRPDSIHAIAAANGRIAIVTNADKNRIIWLNPGTGADTGALPLGQAVVAMKTDPVDGSLIVKQEGTWRRYDFPGGEPREREIDSNFHSDPPPGDFQILGGTGSSYLLDSDGSLFDRATLKYLGCAGLGPVDAALGPQGHPVVMRADSVLAFDNRLLETGRTPLARKAERLAVDHDSVLAFEADGLNPLGISIREIPLASFAVPTAAEVPAEQNPGPDFTASFLTNDGRLGLFYPHEDRVRFWSPAERRWLPSWHLPEDATTAIWSTAGDGLLFGTASRDVRLVLARDPDRLARAVFHTPYPINGLGTFDGFAFATSSSNRPRRGSSLLHSLGGDPSQPFELPNIQTTDLTWHAWAPAHRRLFTVSPHVRPSYREITGTGATAPPGLVTPNQTNTGHRNIHLSPDGQKVAFASGHITDLDLVLLHDLGQEFTDIDWLGASVVTLARRGTAGSTVAVRSTTGNVEATLPLQGAPLRLFSLPGDQVLVITSWESSLRYHLLGRELAPLHDSDPQAPDLARHPVDVRSDFRQDITFTVEVEGTPPFSYQWFKNGVAVPGAVGKTQLLENTGSRAEGSYSVRVTNAHGQTDSNPASLNHGPATRQVFQPGSLLISSNGTNNSITAYQADGTRLANPLSPAELQPVSNRLNGDLIVDRFGRLHVINLQLEESPGIHVSTWDPDTRRWTHQLHEMPEESTPTLDSSLEITGDFLLTSTRRQHLYTGEVTPFSIGSPPVGFDRFSIADDGLMHLVDSTGRWLRADLTSGEVVASTQLPFGEERPITIAAGRNGEAFVGFANDELKRLSPDGTAIHTSTLPLEEPGLSVTLLDLAYSGEDRLAATTSQECHLTNSSLELAGTIAIQGAFVRNHVTWVPVVEPLRPRIEIPAIPAVVSDGPASFPLDGFHPDPDSTLVWSLDSISDPFLFRSLGVDPATGQLNYEPAQWISGSARITVTLVDQLGRKQTITFDLVIAPLPDPELQIAESLVLNRQTGLYEHRITATNPSARQVAGFDLAITGLPAGVTVNNASAREEGTWAVHHRQPLAAGASVTLLVEYYAPVRGTVIDPAVTVTLVSAPENDPSAGEAGLAVDRCELLDDGAVLIEFTSIPGALYEVQYSNNTIDWKTSPVNVRAAGNRVQWIDRGPPRTDTPPSSKSSRFYRVREINHP